MQLEVQLGMGQRIVRHQRCHVGELGALCLEKFFPRRNIEEQIAYRDRGSRRQPSFFHPQHLATRQLNTRAALSVWHSRPRLCICLQHHARHRRDRGQRLAAKAQRSDVQQIVGIFDLGSGVALEGQQRVIVHHAAAVIADLD